MAGVAAASVSTKEENEAETNGSNKVSQNVLLKSYAKEAVEDMDIDVGSGADNASSMPNYDNSVGSGLETQILVNVDESTNGSGSFHSPQKLIGNAADKAASVVLAPSFSDVNSPKRGADATNGALDKSSPGQFSTPRQPDAVVTPKRGLDDLQSSSSAESLSTPPSSGKNKLPNKRRSPVFDGIFNGDNITNDSSSSSDNRAPAECLTPSKSSVEVDSSANVNGSASDKSNQDSSSPKSGINADPIMNDPNANSDGTVLGSGEGSALFGGLRDLHLRQQHDRQVAQPSMSYAGAASKGIGEGGIAIPVSSLPRITRAKDSSLERPVARPRVEAGSIDLSDERDLKCGGNGCVVDFVIVLPQRFDESLSKHANPDVIIIFGPERLGNWEIGYRLEPQSFSDDGSYLLYSGQFQLPFMDNIDYKYALVTNKASQRIKWEYIHCREASHRSVGSGMCNRLLTTKGLTRERRIWRQFDGCMESEHLVEAGLWASLKSLVHLTDSTNKVKEETLRFDFTQCFHFLCPWNRQAGFTVQTEEHNASLISGIFGAASLFPIISTGISQPLRHFFKFAISEPGIFVAFGYLFDFVMKRLITDDCSTAVYYSSVLVVLVAVKLLDGDRSTRLSPDQQSKLLSLFTQPRSATEYLNKLHDDCRSHADQKHIEILQRSFRFLLSICASPSDTLCLVPWLHCLEMSRADPKLPSAVRDNSASWKFPQWTDNVRWDVIHWRDLKAACADQNWQPLLSCPVFQSIVLERCCSIPREIVDFDKFCGHRLSPAQLLRVFESSRFLRISFWQDRLFLVLFLAIADRLDKLVASAGDDNTAPNCIQLLTCFLSRLDKAGSVASAADDQTPPMILKLVVKVVCMVEKAVVFPEAGRTNLPLLWRRAVAVLLSEIFRAKLKLEQVSGLWLDLFAVPLNNLDADEWIGLLAKHFSKSFGERSVDLLQFCFQTHFNKFSEHSKRFCEVEAERFIQKRMEDPRLYDLNVGDKGRFADSLSKTFLTCWPKAAGDGELLAFVTRWPPFKEVHGTQYTRDCILSKDCVTLIERAVALIKRFYGEIRVGSILIPDLDIVMQLKARFVTTAKFCIPTIIESELKQRLDDMEEASARYRRTKEFLKELRGLYCQTEAKFEDLSQLKTKLEQTNLSFNDINLQNDGSPAQGALNVAFFGLSPAWSVAEFERAAKASRSAYWQRCWFDACDALPEPISINDTLPVLLHPVSDNARRFVQSFLHGSVKLGELASVMERCELKDVNDLQCEVELLRDSFMIKHAFPLQERMKQVQIFLNATAAVAAGEVIMQVQRLLKLEGSFREVEAIMSMASRHDDMLLLSVNESVMKAGKNLVGISPEQIDCLRALLDADDLIKWIYEMNAQEKDLHTFVEIASTNVGESDIELALIANFNVCITAFAPLLFVPKHAGFAELQKQLERVWSALDKDKTLPKKLRDSSRNVNRFKDLWSAQGSLEKSSIVQVQAINKHGIFRIGCISSEDHKKTPGNSVILAFDNLTEEHNLTLSKLKDLHSRLMLIGCQMNQNQADAKREISRFSEILDGVQRLAELYVAHCAAGNVFFLEWQCEIVLDCDSSVNPTVKFHKIDRLLRGDNISATESLHKLCVFFKEALEGWQEYMAKLRDQFPELNFYRNSQLVKLRRDLAKLSDTQIDDEQPINLDLSTKMLLMHIDPNVRIDDVDDCFHSYRPESQATEEELMNDDLLSEDQQEFLAYLREEAFIPERVLKEAAVAADWSRDNVDRALEFAASHDGLLPAKKLRAVTPVEAIELEDGDVWTQLENRWKHHLKHQEATDDNDFVSLRHLGHTCKRLLELAPASTPPPLPGWLKANEPNLIIQPQLQLLKFCVAAYLTYDTAVFPKASSVLVCKADMPKEDIRLFFLRLAKADPNQLYSVVNAEVLRGDLAHVFEREVEALLNDKVHACLAVYCADEGFERSSIAGLMNRWLRKVAVSEVLWDRIQVRVMENLGKRSSKMEAQEALLYQRAVICTSIRSGQGKSLCINRQVETLNHSTATSYVKIPVHDSVVDSETMVPLLLKLDKPHSTNRVIHIDILDSLSENIDGFLFELLVLGSLTDSRGQVWRFMPTDLYAIEVCSAPSKYLLPPNGELDMARNPDLFRFLFQAVLCLSPSHALEMESGAVCYSGAGVVLQPYDHEELTSVPFERCYWYLTNRLLHGFEAMNFVEQNDFPDTCNIGQLIETLLTNMGIEDPSWTEVKHFVSFFNVQLQDYERSTYCNYELMQEDLPGFRTFLLSFLLEMARDFSTRSLEIAEEAMGLHEEAGGGVAVPQLEDYQPKRRWETCPHPYIFFNSDHHTLTFFGCYLDRAGNLIDLSRPDRILKPGITTSRLVTGLWMQGVDFTKTFDKLPRVEKLNTLRRVIGAKESDFDPDPNYEITADCAMKILAIYMRFRCGIPCVLMGETGVGKTKLVQFLCALEKGRPSSASDNMIIVKVHGGTTYSHIRYAVETAQRAAKPENPICLFFDEANATNAISMLKEVMSDGTIDGRPLAEQGLNIVAAVNPYKKHSEEMIRKLESSGFGYRVNQTKAVEKFGNTPLRQLVYRVHRLPSSLLPLVWDFGTLKDDVEEIYISQMIDNFAKKLPANAADGFRQASTVIVKVISSAQRYMRCQEFEAKFVSLRDVERMLLVMQWLLKHEDPLFKLMNGKLTKKGKQVVGCPVTRCVLLAVCVCYRATLQQHRDQFDRRMAKHFTGALTLPSGAASFQDEIQAAQEVFIDRENITLDPNIAANEALRENIFMMVACIELRIPLFIVGKPGSSKSLAKTIVAEAMRGPSSQGKLFKTFKQAAIVSYQCSPLATAEGVELVFKQCARQQKDLSLDQYVAVAVFDEIGLAEDSPLLPLKALHGLLVEGCQIADEALEAYHRVGFIGISNWALDPAKMNRGIFVSRILPTEDELLITAKQIAHGNSKKISDFVLPFMEPLTTAYNELYQAQLSSHQSANNALARGEVKVMEFFGLRDFYSLVKMVYDATALAKPAPRRLRYNEMVRVIMRNFSGKDGDRTAAFHVFASKLIHVLSSEEPIYPKVEDLVRENLDSELSRQRENRYLLILTENYAALSLKSKIPKLKNALIIFGSSFPHDLEYTQVCMDKGTPIILLNLESLYESLYDLLNQAFLMHGDERFVDLGLGTHRMKCHVHKEFRLIVIAQKAEVYQWPAALINRLEKHYFSLLTELSPEQRDLASTLDDWASEFAMCSSLAQNSKSFEASDVFIGYSGKETAAAIIAEIGGLTIADDGPETILETAKRLLLQCATPESVVRALAVSAISERKETVDWCFEVYFKEQSHKDLITFLQNELFVPSLDLKRFFQITTHSRLLSKVDLQFLAAETNMQQKNICCLQLMDFATELQFSNSITQVFVDAKAGERFLLIVQCFCDKSNLKLVDCARYLLEQLANDNEAAAKNVVVVLLLSLPRAPSSGFVGFQLGSWSCHHVDDLMVQQTETEFDLANCYPKSISQLCGEFINSLQQMDAEGSACVNFLSLVKDCICSAAAAVQDVFADRAISRPALLMKLTEDNGQFQEFVLRQLHKLHHEKDSADFASSPSAWFTRQAANINDILEQRTFRQSLVKKIESSITPLLAGLFAAVDCGANLDIVPNTALPGVYQQLWFKLANDLLAISYDADYFAAGEYRVPLGKFAVRRLSADANFTVSFPFSWLIKARISKVLADVSSLRETEDSSEVDVIERCQSLLSSEPWSCALLEGALPEQMLGDYIVDFVHMSCDVPSKLEAKLIGTWIRQVVGRHRVLPAVHCAFETIQEHVKTLLLLTAKWPQAIAELLKEENAEMCRQRFASAFDVVGFDFVMGTLDAEIKQIAAQDQKLPEAKRRWKSLQGDICAVTPFVSRLLSLRTGDQAMPFTEHLLELKSSWKHVQILRLFLDHMLLVDRVVLPIKQLWAMLQRFKGAFTVKFLEMLVNVFTICHNEWRNELFGLSNNELSCAFCSRPMTAEEVLLPCLHLLHERCRDRLIGLKQKTCPAKGCDKPLELQTTSTAQTNLKNALAKFYHCRNALNSFFMEFVSSFLFADEAALPDADVFDFLLRCVTQHTRTDTNEQTTSILSAFKNDALAIDSTPVIRTFLLQVVLKLRPILVKDYLRRYFQRNEPLMDSSEDRKQLALLFVQCVEDTKNAEVPIDVHEQINWVLENLRSQEFIASLQTTAIDVRQLDVDWLFDLAVLRVVLATTANLLAELVSNKPRILLHDVEALLFRLETQLKSRNVPLLFLCKQLCQIHGISVFKQVVQHQKCKWIVPEAISDQLGEGGFADWALIYDEAYLQVKGQLLQTLVVQTDGAAAANNVEAVWRASNDDERLYLFLAACNFASASAVTREAIDRIWPILELNLANTKLHRWATLYIRNQHASQLKRAFTEAGSPISLNFIFQLIGILSFQNNSDVGSFFAHLLDNPDAFVNSFLPTMPDNPVAVMMAEVRQLGHAAAVYSCSNGHPYTIGDCTRPVIIGTCPDCGVQIGGVNYRLAPGNQPVAANDIIDPNGYLLTGPTTGNVCLPERQMSSVQTGFMRALLNATLFCTSVFTREASQRIVKKRQIADPTAFFLQMFRDDLAKLSRSLRLSLDDVCMYLVALIRGLHERRTVAAPLGLAASLLQTKAARDQWETTFTRLLLTGIEANVGRTLRDFRDLLMKDTHDGPLMRVIFESVSDTATDLGSVLWSFRRQQNVEALMHEALQQIRSSPQAASFALLSALIANAATLGKLRYLPSVAWLHVFLKNHFCGILDLGRIERETVGSFLHHFDSNQSEKRRLEESVRQFFEVWEILSVNMDDKMAKKLRLPFDAFRYNSLNYKGCPLLLIMPINHRLGHCSLFVIGHLVEIQNRFIEEQKQFFVDPNTILEPVDIYEATENQLLCFDLNEDVLPLIVMHRILEFTVGSTKLEASFDLIGLQRRISAKLFSHCRPLTIQSTKTGLLKLKECLVLESILETNKKFAEVELEIARGQRKDVIKSLRRNLPDVTAAVELVELLLKFAGSCSKDMEMRDLIVRLNLQDRLQSFALLNDFSFGELPSLWRILALEQKFLLFAAKQQELFSDEMLHKYAVDLYADDEQTLLRKLQHGDAWLFLARLTQFIFLELQPLVGGVEHERVREHYDLNSYFEFLDLNLPDTILVKHAVTVWKMASQLYVIE